MDFEQGSHLQEQSNKPDSAEPIKFEPQPVHVELIGNEQQQWSQNPPHNENYVETRYNQSQSNCWYVLLKFD